MASRNSHEEEETSPFRTYLRNAMLPQILKEVPYVVEAQKGRSKAKDIYFKAWSVLGSHAGYMIGIPLFFWLGFSHYALHLTFLMASGLMACNFLKDYLCLPRPTSPPVVRLSDSHNLEYGFPSSHSVNALNFPLFSAYWFIQSHEGPLNLFESTGLILMVLFVCLSISYSRIYCGMHCYTDILGGFAIGLILLAALIFYRQEMDHWMVFGDNVMIYSITLMSVFMWSYPIPWNDTPSFSDSISFGFVCIGMVFGTWRRGNDPLLEHPSPFLALFPFDFNSIGYFGSLLRVVIGITSILIWRVIAKKVCQTILPPIGSYFNKVFSIPSSNSQENAGDQERKISGLFARFDAEMITKAAVYIGIGWLACDGASFLFELAGVL